MVDTLVLGASAVRREGSSPFIRTKQVIVSLMTVPSSLQKNAAGIFCPLPYHI